MIIGIVGAARSGKGTVSETLMNTFDGFRELSFADKLKEMCMEMLGLTWEQCYGDQKEILDQRYGKTPRWLLQYMGTEVFRSIYPEIWIWHWDNTCTQLLRTEGVEHIIVPDVRFPNEVRAIKARGGYIWKTVREGHHGASGGIEGHASENSLTHLQDSEIDLVLTAPDGELDITRQRVREEARKLLGARARGVKQPSLPMV